VLRTLSHARTKRLTDTTQLAVSSNSLLRPEQRPAAAVAVGQLLTKRTVDDELAEVGT
jgi:hypothetical protein